MLCGPTSAIVIVGISHERSQQPNRSASPSLARSRAADGCSSTISPASSSSCNQVQSVRSPPRESCFSGNCLFTHQQAKVFSSAVHARAGDFPVEKV